MTVWVLIIQPGVEMAHRAISIGVNMLVRAVARGPMWIIWMKCLGVGSLNSSAPYLAWITPFHAHRVISRNSGSASKKPIKEPRVSYNLTDGKNKSAFQRGCARVQKYAWLVQGPMGWIYI